MNQEIDPIIMDKLTKVCLCRGISRATIKEAVKKGARTIEEVAGVTGATKGSCSGMRCKEKIQDIIDDYYSQFE